MIVGIDLGTTNSLIAYFDEEKGATIIPNRLGNKLTPSVVSFDKDGTIYVGETAKERRITNPKETVEVFKRDMGTAKTWNMFGKEYTPTDLSALVLRSLKEDAQNYLKEEITEAVISVPAYFNEHQRKATKMAGKLAGLKVERIISEPTAAAIAYGINNCQDSTKIMVFDLGGGTFDVSLLELEDGVMEVHCVAGDNFLGGEDFTKVIFHKFLQEKGLDKESLSVQTRNHISKQAELCKLELSDHMSAVMKCKVEDEILEMIISREEFKDDCEELLERIKKPIARSLRNSKLSIEDIDRVVMVGGSTRLPLVRSYVATLLRKIPDYSVNPDEVVVIGACMQAAMKERNEALEDLILTDVCPYTLGIGIRNRNGSSDIYSPIIQRNTTIPYSRTRKYVTVHDYQKEIEINIYQGENRLVDKNLFIDKITIQVPPNKAGQESVSVTFTYDVNSLLEVIVKSNTTEEVVKKIIRSSEFDISEEEAERRFAELDYLKLPPREQEENKLVLFRAEELYEELLGMEREIMGQNISIFEGILENGDPEEIEEAREEMKRILERYF
ncbi:MAG: molecular chaperone HscC [Lachnospiraceae bacterium]|nr:molecular chaperone HscC [Lachnospiraceae bacterium]